MSSLNCSGCGSSSSLFKINALNCSSDGTSTHKLKEKETNNMPNFKGSLNCRGCGNSDDKLGKNLDKSI